MFIICFTLKAYGEPSLLLVSTEQSGGRGQPEGQTAGERAAPFNHPSLKQIVKSNTFLFICFSI